MNRKNELFLKEFNKLMKDAVVLKKDTIDKMVKILEYTRKDIVSTIASTEWEAYYLDSLKHSVDRAINDFKAKYLNVMDEQSRTAWDIGRRLIDEPLRKMNMFIPVGDIDTRSLSIMQDYSADLITNLSNDAINKINNVLTLNVLGKQTVSKTIKDIGSNLTSKSVFSSIKSRAEVITVTELGRVTSTATELRGQEMAKKVPGMMKEWIHAPYVRNPRPEHFEVNDVPADKDFIVNGYRMRFPRDPKGPPSETIGCHCYHRFYVVE